MGVEGVVALNVGHEDMLPNTVVVKKTVAGVWVTVTVAGVGHTPVDDAETNFVTVSAGGQVAGFVVTDTTVYVLGAGYVVGVIGVVAADGLDDTGTTGTEVEYFTGAVEVLTVV